MKKVFTLALSAILLVMAFAGCAPAASPASSSSAAAPESLVASPEATESGLTFKFGVAMRRYDDTFLTDERNAIIKACEDLQMPVDIVDSQASQTTQNDKIDIFLTKKYSAIGINLQELSAAQPLIDKCKEIGAAAIFFNNNPEDAVFDTYEKAYYIGAKADQSGIFQGEMIAEYFKNNPDADKNKDGKLQYIMLTGDPGSQDMLLRTKCSVETVEAAGIKTECLGQDIASWDRVKGQEKMAAFIAAKGDAIEAVFANNDDMALGAIEALKAAGYFQGKKGDAGYKYIPVVGVDATVPGIAALEDGTLLGTVLNDAVNQGTATAKVAYNLSKNQPINEQTIGYKVDGKFIWIPYVKITLENVAQFKK